MAALLDALYHFARVSLPDGRDGLIIVLAAYFGRSGTDLSPSFQAVEPVWIVIATGAAAFGFASLIVRSLLSYTRRS